MFGKKVKHIYFVGIGGIGMSGIAELLLNLGYRVSGSDLKDGPATLRLRSLGARINIGHDGANINKELDVLVFSSAVSGNNPEILAARKYLIPVIPRGEMLAELMRLKHGIAISGTHGKTTTTSMVATVLAYAELDPTAVIGGRLASFGSNARLGSGEYLVAEADESDGSFLHLSPVITVVTTIDAEHLDHYHSLERLRESFLQFINKVPFYGSAILCRDDENIQKILPKVHKRYLTYGLTHQADLVAENLLHQQNTSRATICYKQQKLGYLKLPIPGTHNIYNALAAIGVGLELGIEYKVIQRALADFTGVDRRFQKVGEVGHILIVDDYGHHPTEIKATLRAAKQGWGRRCVALFQPHRYTRTQLLLEDFWGAFQDADVLLITNIYAASEEPIPGVTAEAIVEGVRRSGHPCVEYIPELKDMIPRTLELLEPGDMVITLGAGTIGELPWKLKAKLEPE